MAGESADPNSPANTIGVPVQPFPAWFRCTRCQQLGSLESGMFEFANDIASRPFEARFTHPNCQRRSRAAVPARFLVTCRNGHLDEFPYAWFVHEGLSCPSQLPALYMYDAGAEAAANVTIKCKSCGKSGNMARAQGRAGVDNLPGCRGRHPHLGTFERCDEQAELLVVGSSNQWFAETIQTLALPDSDGSELVSVVDQLWDKLSVVTVKEVLAYAYAQQFHDQLGGWPLDDVWNAVQAKRDQESGSTLIGKEDQQRPSDLLAPEWELLTRTPPPEPKQDFTVRIPDSTQRFAGLADVRQVERLRLARALIGFTRLDAPDPEEEHETVPRAPLATAAPTWVPASEVRGEGLFISLDPAALATWEARVNSSPVVDQHRRAFARFRMNRASSRNPHGPGYDWTYGWPGLRYYLVHSFSHVMLRAIALECGYAGASLAERVYARSDTELAGFLIYTAVPDAEGTLGGLVSLGEPTSFKRVLDRALGDAQRCSSDPLCGETAPHGSSDACYAASCHVCMFISETSCERGNRFLDRRLLVDLGTPDLAYFGP
jgi:hypothetical protein